GPSRARSGRRSSSTWPRSGSATATGGPTRIASRRCWPAGPSGPGRSPRTPWPTCASGWASEFPVGASRYGEPVTLAALELDLDVFSGPFDLLLALVLREEVDLLELQLADVVLAYLHHLEARGELDLETATEF